MKIQRKFLFFTLSLLTGCVTTQMTNQEMEAYKNQNVRDFLKDQTYYNLIDTKDPNLFIYDSALYVEKQVMAPSSNIKLLCSTNGGIPKIESFNENPILDQSYISNVAFNYRHELISRNDAELALQKGAIANDFYGRAMSDYIKKGYFFNSIKCVKSGKTLWSAQVIPGVPRKDSSDIDSLYIYMHVTE